MELPPCHKTLQLSEKRDVRLERWGKAVGLGYARILPFVKLGEDSNHSSLTPLPLLSGAAAAVVVVVLVELCAIINESTRPLATLTTVWPSGHCFVFHLIPYVAPVKWLSCHALVMILIVSFRVPVVDSLLMPVDPATVLIVDRNRFCCIVHGKFITTGPSVRWIHSTLVTWRVRHAHGLLESLRSAIHHPSA